jgi:hypothetical protein
MEIFIVGIICFFAGAWIGRPAWDWLKGLFTSAE